MDTEKKRELTQELNQEPAQDPVQAETQAEISAPVQEAPQEETQAETSVQETSQEETQEQPQETAPEKKPRRKRGKKEKEKHTRYEHEPTLGVIRKFRERIRNIREIKSFFFRFAMLIAFLVIMFYAVFGLYSVNNDDMSPRISAGDLLLFFRFSTDFVADDIIIYRAGDANHVGRVIAKGGDTVEVRPEGGLIVNGHYKTELEIFYDTYSYEDYVDYPVTVEDGDYFVLADHREGAQDSRYYGTINRNQIIGEVISLMRRGKL